MRSGLGPTTAKQPSGIELSGWIGHRLQQLLSVTLEAVEQRCGNVTRRNFQVVGFQILSWGSQKNSQLGNRDTRSAFRVEVCRRQPMQDAVSRTHKLRQGMDLESWTAPPELGLPL